MSRYAALGLLASAIQVLQNPNTQISNVDSASSVCLLHATERIADSLESLAESTKIIATAMALESSYMSQPVTGNEEPTGEIPTIEPEPDSGDLTPPGADEGEVDQDMPGTPGTEPVQPPAPSDVENLPADGKIAEDSENPTEKPLTLSQRKALKKLEEQESEAGS